MSAITLREAEAAEEDDMLSAKYFLCGNESDVSDCQ